MSVIALDAVFISYENVTGPYSYELKCNPSDPPNSLQADCTVEDTTPPNCSGMKAGGVICHGKLKEPGFSMFILVSTDSGSSRGREM